MEAPQMSCKRSVVCVRLKGTEKEDMRRSRQAYFPPAARYPSPRDFSMRRRMPKAVVRGRDKSSRDRSRIGAE